MLQNMLFIHLQTIGKKMIKVSEDFLKMILIELKNLEIELEIV